MQIVNQSALLLLHNKPHNEFIEQVARVCYKSEKHIKEGSADKLVYGLVSNAHLAMIEHEYIYMKVNDDTWDAITMLEAIMLKVDDDCHINKYLNFGCMDSLKVITGSLRAWREWSDNLKKYIFSDDLVQSNEFMNVFNLLHLYDEVIFPYHYSDIPIDKDAVKLLTREEIEDICDKHYSVPCCLLPHTIKFITSRAVATEMIRHRPASPAMESQRYVDYKKNGGIDFITPMIDPNSYAYQIWHYAAVISESQYIDLRKLGIPPEIARGVLPNDCKTEIVVTATEEEWQHIINLRYHGTTGAPHPQMKQLMELAYPILQHESGGRIK